MQVVRASGAGQIITVSVRPGACAMLRELRADHVIDAKETDPVDAIRNLTGETAPMPSSSAPEAAPSKDWRASRA
jgi:NADPH:quinone reductase-like Zn-dependent oxidoreductase